MFQVSEQEPPISVLVDAEDALGLELSTPPGVIEIGSGSYGSHRYASTEYDRGQTVPSEALPDGAQDPKETIAALRRMLAERDHALLRSALVTSDLRQELDDTRTGNETLQKELTNVTKTNESLTKAAEQAASTRAAAPAQEDVARMKDQFRRAQKALQREHARVRDELVRTKGEMHRVQQQLEIEARARQVESAQASVKIAAMKQQMEEIAKASFDEATSQKGHGKARRLWIGAGSVAAVLTLTVGLWSQSWGHPVEAKKPAADSAQPSSVPAPIASVVTQAPARYAITTTTETKNPFASQASFQHALSHLNQVLSGPLGRTPEQLLAEVKDHGSKSGTRVCDFQWNGGQPALVYGAGPGATLESSLNRCATAVEIYLAHK